MKTIFKYRLPAGGFGELLIPSGARHLSVGFQRDELQVWMLVDPSEVKVPIGFYVATTGSEIPLAVQSWPLVGRAVTPDDSYVVHVFRRP